MEKKVIVYLFLLFSLINIMQLSQAKLLINPDSINITKTYGSDYHYFINITNPENYDFYDIQIPDNNYVLIDKISLLRSGETKVINLTIFSNDTINTDFNIKGFYQANTGISGHMYFKTITINGVQDCDSTSINKGDSIDFINNEKNYDVTVIRNGETAPFLTIPRNSSITLDFLLPGDYIYKFYLQNAFLIGTCDYQVKENTGLVNDKNLDANLKVNININYSSTAINTYFFNNNYSMKFYDEKSDIIKIVNVGSNTAKNINLDAPWIVFDKNNFDLNPGEDINIKYTIKPLNYIINTSMTNHTYILPLEIKGNFNTQTINFSVFINYASLNEIEENNQTSSLISIIEEYCFAHPDICSTEPKIVYKYIDNSTDDQEISVNMSASSLREMFKFLITLGDDIQTNSNQQKEMNDNLKTEISEIKTNLTQQTQQITEQESNRKTTNTFIIIVMFSFLGLFAVLLLSTLIYINKKSNKFIDYRRWGGVIKNDRK